MPLRLYVLAKVALLILN